MGLGAAARDVIIVSRSVAKSRVEVRNGTSFKEWPKNEG